MNKKLPLANRMNSYTKSNPLSIMPKTEMSINDLQNNKQTHMKKSTQLIGALLFLIFATIFSSQVNAQAVGDYQSNGNGTWGGTYNWKKCTVAGSFNSTTTTQPSSTTNVTIANGDVMTILGGTTSNCNNLVFAGSSGLVLGTSASSSGATLNVYGNLNLNSTSTITSSSILNAGSIVANAIVFQSATSPVKQTMTLNGNFGDYNTAHCINVSEKTATDTLLITSTNNSADSAYFSKLYPQVGNNITITVDRNITLNYTGSTPGGGGVALMANQLDGIVFNVNAGSTLYFVDKSYPGVGSSTTTIPATPATPTLKNTTFNINGSLILGGSNNFHLSNPGAAYSTTLNIGGTLTLGTSNGMFVKTTAPNASGPVSININNGGLINFTGAASILDSNTTMTINSGGTFDLTNCSTAKRVLGAVTVNSGGKIAFGDNTYPVGSSFNNSTITLNSGSTVQYNGTGYILPVSPTTYPSLTINSSGTLTAPSGLIVNGDLTLKAGIFADATYTIAVGGNLYGISGTHSGTGKISMTGSHQYIGGVTVGNLYLNNGFADTLSGNTTVNGSLTLANHNLVLGNNNLILTAANAVAGTPTVANHVVTNGTGYVQAAYSTGSYTFPVGYDSANYNPVKITNNISGGATSQTYTVLAKAVTGTISNSTKAMWGIGGITTASTSLSFPWNSTNDVTGTAPTSGSVYQYISSAWGSPLTGTTNTVASPNDTTTATVSSLSATTYLTIVNCVNPTISSQPVSTTSYAGTDVNPTFVVGVSGGASVQWQYSANGTSSWTNVTTGTTNTPANYTYNTGTTNDTLTVATTTSASGPAYYRAVVSVTGGCSVNSNNSVGLTLNTPSNPTISSITPTHENEGSVNNTIIVKGTNFVSGISTIQWNGINLTTSFDSSKQLKASIPDSLVKVGTGGSHPNITVYTTGASSPTSSAIVDTIITAPNIAITALASTAYGNITVNQSLTDSFTVSASSLDGTDVTISAPTGFKVSKTYGSGYASSVTYTGYGSTINQKIFVIFQPTAVQSYNGNISYSGGGVSSTNYAITGAGVNVTAPSSASVTHYSNNIQRLTWTSPSGTYDSVLVFASTSNTAISTTGHPGTYYTGANSDITVAPGFSGYSLVYVGKGNSLEVTNLTNNSTYYYQVISYSGDSFARASIVNQIAILQGVGTSSTSASSGQATISWSNPSYFGSQSNYWDSVIVIASTGTITDPTGAGLSPSNSVYGTANTADGNGGFKVYTGTGTSVTITGLTNLTTYNVNIYVRHGSLWSTARATTVYPNAFATGDYVSIASGTYRNSSTWGIWNGTSAAPTTLYPSQIRNANAWIVNGNTVTLTESNSCMNLHVLNGTIKTNTSVQTALLDSIYGNTIEVQSQGIIGNGPNGPGNDSANGFSFIIKNAGTTTITGTGGNIDLSRLVLGTSNASLIIDQNLTVHYHGTTNGGATGLTPNNSSTTGKTTTAIDKTSITINQNKTLTMDKWSNIGVSSVAAGYGSTPAASFTIRVNGTLNFLRGIPVGDSNLTGGGHNGALIQCAAAGYQDTLIIGSTGKVYATEFYPNGDSSSFVKGPGSLSYDSIAVGGEFYIDSVADLRNPNQTIIGGGKFQLNGSPGAIIKIGSPYGITNATTGSTGGNIQTGTRNFDPGATYSYDDTLVAQITGDALPNPVFGLRINNKSGVRLSGIQKVSGSLILNDGILTINGDSLILGSSAAMTATGNDSSFVSGPLVDSISGTTATTIVFPIGKAGKYSPVTLKNVVQSSASTYRAEAFVGSNVTPFVSSFDNVSLSAISNHRYYNLTSSLSGNIISGNITLPYSVTDTIGGGVSINTPANIRIADSVNNNWTNIGSNSGGTAGYITSNNITSLGEFVIADGIPLITPPSAIPTTLSESVDNDFTIGYGGVTAWLNNISGITYGSNDFTSVDYSTSGSVLTLKPSGSSTSGLRLPGTKTLYIHSSGYEDATIQLTMLVGADAKLGMKTNPVPAAINGKRFATQPAVYIQDQWGNITTSTSNVTVSVGSGGTAGAWNLIGSHVAPKLTIAAVNGVATFDSLYANSAVADTGATMHFTSGFLTPVNSAGFNLSAPATYYWVGGASNAWNASNVWSTSTSGSPTVTIATPDSSSIFIFDGTIGGSTTITTFGGSSQTNVGQIIVRNGANVTLNTTSARTYNIWGMSGTDLSVDATSSLSTGGTNTISITMQTGTTGDILGTINLGAASGTQTITVADQGALVFENHSNCNVNVATTVHPFGTTSASNAVDFKLGSKLTSIKSSDPFGGSGASITKFEKGSTYEIQNRTPIIYDGNNFSNFIYNYSSTDTVFLTSTGVSFDSLQIKQGKLLFKTTTAPTHIKRDIIISNGGSLIFSPYSASTVYLDGDTAQTITNNGTFSDSANQVFSVNNTNGVKYSGPNPLYIGGVLNLNSGTFTVGADTLILANPITGTATNLAAGSTSSISIIGSASGVNIPSSVTTLNNVILNNANGTTLQHDLKIEGVAILTSGALSIANDTLIIDGSIAYTGGSLRGSNYSKLKINGSASYALPLDQSSPSASTNGLNSFELNTSGTISLGTLDNLTINNGGTLTLTQGTLHLTSDTLTVAGTIANTGTGAINATNGGLYYTATSGTLKTTQLISGLVKYLIIGNGTVASTINLSGDLGVTGVLNTKSNSSFGLGSNTLSLSGSTAGTGTFIGSPSSNLSISSAASNTLYFASADSLRNLTISGSGQVSLGSSVAITNLLSLKNASGSLNTTNGHLTLKSTASKTAEVDSVSTGFVMIGGNITVERYIPQGLWEYEDLGTSGVTAAGSVFNNWQENGALNSNYGIYITGNTGSNSSNAANGFDITYMSKNASMWSYTRNNWYDVKNTYDTMLNATKGYRVFVRGNRNFTLYQTLIQSQPTTMFNEATLRTTGYLVTGKVRFTTGTTYINYGSIYQVTEPGITGGIGNWNLIANPYACPINWTNVLSHNANAGSNVSTTYYFLTKTTGGSNTYVTVNSNGISASANPSMNGNHPELLNIQAGQGFWVYNTGSTPVLTIGESDKVSGQPQTGVFGTASNNLLSISLQKSNEVIDGTVVSFDNTYSKSIGMEDSRKMMNSGENIYITESKEALSIEGLPVPTEKDEIALNLSNVKANVEYTLLVDINKFNAGVQAYIKDATTNKVVLASLGIKFTPTSDAASYTNRFSLVFKPATSPTTVITSTEAKASVSVYPNPVTEKTFTLQMSNIAKGKYNVTVIDNLGKELMTTVLNHETTTNNETIRMSNSLPTGMYRVVVKNSVSGVVYENSIITK